MPRPWRTADAAHARNQAAGRALARALYEQHSNIDGIWFRSRLTGGACLAIFDRALKRLNETSFFSAAAAALSRI